jgi:hypothetical protein
MRKGRLLVVRVTAADVSRYEAAARVAGQGVSAWVREVLYRAWRDLFSGDHV